jgi:hypothetical protein
MHVADSRLNGQSGVFIVAKIFRLSVILQFISFALPLPAAAQSGFPPPYPSYPPQRYSPPDSSLRLNVKPKEASVYVDGYYAGKVDDFDGRFQRLHVPAGQHEVVVYLDGFHSLKQMLYLAANATRTIDGQLERLAPGDPEDPLPQPAEPPRAAPPDQPYPPAAPQMPRARGRRNPDQPPSGQQPLPSPPPASESSRSRYAALSFKVEPDAATIRIDGERWDGPSGDERLIVQVSEGHHTIEVEHEGYDGYVTELDVHAGETHPVNINLRRR